MLHATALAAGPVREALRSGDAALVRATLEILVAWARAIPLEELDEFLSHRERDIRILAIEAHLDYVAGGYRRGIDLPRAISNIERVLAGRD